MSAVAISVINDLVTDQRVQRVAGTFRRQGYQVLLIGRKLPGSLPSDNLQFRTRRFVMIFKKGPLFYTFYNIRLFLFLMFTRKPASLYAVDLDTLPANYLVSRLRKIPLLYDSHEYFTEVPELVDRKFVKSVWSRIESAIVPRLETCIAVCDSIAKMYSEKYRTEFVTIRNVGHYKTPEEFPDFHKRYLGRYKIIYQGALNKGRGIELLIRSMKFVDDSILFIVGDGDIRKELIRLVSELKLNDKIFFTGRVSPEELHRITSQADVGISLEEDIGLNYRFALPNKIFDYIQARIPVLCSDLPEMARLIREYDIGEVCASRNETDLSFQLGEMLRNQGKREQWKVNLEIAARDLSWENEERKLLELI